MGNLKLLIKSDWACVWPYFFWGGGGQGGAKILWSIQSRVPKPCPHRTVAHEGIGLL